MDSNLKNMLEESPMFQLSLGSKELFHSNFLYWLWKSEPDAFWNTMKCLEIPLDDKERENLTVEREWENFDLCIVRKEKRRKRGTKEEVYRVKDIIAVIENKVKSLPREDQLEGYNDKILKLGQNPINTKRILLSLPDPPFDNKKARGWERVTYNQYLDALPQRFANQYRNEILQDYRGLINALINLGEEWVPKNFGETKYLNIIESDSAKIAQELRINDMRHKLIFSAIFLKFKERVKQLLQNYPQLEIEIGNDISKCDFHSVFIECNYSFSGGGLVSFSIQMSEKGYCFGVQLQGVQYRRIITWNSKNTSFSENEAKAIIAEQPFLNMNHEHNNKKTLHFGHSFLYNYKKIDENTSVDNVIGMLINDMEYCLNLKNKMHF